MEKENPILKRTLQLLSLTMIALFFGLGFFIWLNPSFLEDRLPQPNRSILILILFVYGVFRGSRAISKMRRD